MQRNVDIVESRRNGPQHSMRHDDDDDDDDIILTKYAMKKRIHAGIPVSLGVSASLL